MSLIDNLNTAPALLLLVAVVAVGILHTMVPDHWVPITMLARQHGWSRGETARAAAQAGFGHVVSTLIIGVIIWLLGVATAQRFGGIIDTLSSVALIGFGGWFVIAGLRELRHERGGHHHGHAPGHTHNHGHHHDHDHDHDHGHAHGETTIRHVHLHRHANRPPHVHLHAHAYAMAHTITAAIEHDPPLHDHDHKATGRGALLLIL